MNGLQMGQTIRGKSYDYTITDHSSAGRYEARLKVRGNLGIIDSGIAVVLLTTRRNDSNLIETISFQDAVYYVYTQTSEDSVSEVNTEWILFGQHRYRGDLKDGLPHGKGEMRWQNCNQYRGDWVGGCVQGYGIMTWPSGKRYEGLWQDGWQEGLGIMFYPNGSIYEGEFHNGKREGHGILRQPNGGYYEGAFVDDKPSERMAYVDTQGVRHEDVELKKQTEPSLIAKIWNKTWRLWASLVCFGLAVLFAFWVSDFFSGNGPSHISAKGLLAPIALGILGIRLFIGFLGDTLPD